MLALLTGLAITSPVFGQAVAPPQGCTESPGLGVAAGTVLDDTTGSPKPGARVAVYETECWSLADDAGSYIVVGIPNGEHRLVAKYQGYLGAIQVVDVIKDDTIVADYRMRRDPGYLPLCDADDVENGTEWIPSGPISTDLAARYTAQSTHGWACVSKHLRRRLAGDSATVALYADWLTGKKAPPEWADPGSMLYILALAGRPEHLPIFLSYAHSDASRNALWGAVEGLIRATPHSEQASTRLVSLHRSISNGNSRFDMLQALVRINNQPSRQYLRELMETGTVDQYRVGMVRRALDRAPCPSGTFLDLRRFSFSGCLSHDP